MTQRDYSDDSIKQISKRREISKAEIEVNWTEFSSGTGAMVKALAEGSQDACVVLTEGAVADIVQACVVTRSFVRIYIFPDSPVNTTG